MFYTFSILSLSPELMSSSLYSYDYWINRMQSTLDLDLFRLIGVTPYFEMLLLFETGFCFESLRFLPLYISQELSLDSYLYN